VSNCVECNSHHVYYRCEDCGEYYCESCAEEYDFRCDCIAPNIIELKELSEKK
jgi:uncharacterized Zn ribbon protein